jgi:hypothetical protein
VERGRRGGGGREREREVRREAETDRECACGFVREEQDCQLDKMSAEDEVSIGGGGGQRTVVWRLGVCLEM